MKKLLGIISVMLAATTSFAAVTQLPKFIKVIWDGHEYTTTDEKEIEEILNSDLVKNPKVIIQKGEANMSQPTTISVVKEN
ncbi:MAG: hypothetical protein JSU04_06195 [Bdellovibrionales bacterium]|nr:hypothetical protein [Bdellovibrionales bacterium]